MKLIDLCPARLICAAMLTVLPGCAVINTPTMKLTLLCNKSIVDSTGFNITDENLRHVRCNKKTPLRFTYSF